MRTEQIEAGYKIRSYAVALIAETKKILDDIDGHRLSDAAAKTEQVEGVANELGGLIRKEIKRRPSAQ